jgi:AcrR family transcriptional regulator
MPGTVSKHSVDLTEVRAVTNEMRARLRSDARDNRAHILAVARAAFAVGGLDVPIREIARRAAVGAATVYRHFGTKEALLAAVFADQMTSCAEIVRRGLAADDPWQGLRLVVEQLMTVHARDRGFARAFTSRVSEPPELAAARDRTLASLFELVRQAKDAGSLREDFVLEDINLALLANEGIRADTPEMRLAASRRFAALMLQSFQAHPVPGPHRALRRDPVARMITPSPPEGEEGAAVRAYAHSVSGRAPGTMVVKT